MLLGRYRSLRWFRETILEKAQGEAFETLTEIPSDPYANADER
jgi:hypothetical protein